MAGFGASGGRVRVVAILGPTASGKARLAVEAARRSGARLLSCDSMKVYRGMDVGTAKPRPTDRAGVDWHGLDLAWPWETYDASRFAALFEELRAASAADGRPLILSGGTMLYLKAATEGLDSAAPRDPDLRRRLVEEAERGGLPALHARLARVDPEAAAKVHPHDLRRIVRALEVLELTGRPFSAHRGRFGRVRDDLERVAFVVTRERADLAGRVARRVDRMLAEGWLEECRALRDDPRGVSAEAAQALGYRQILAWLEQGEREPWSEVCERIRSATWRFARQQLTWLKHLQGTTHPLAVEPGGEALEHLERVLSAL